MTLKPILPFTRSLLEQVIQQGDIVVDATMGNGIDTCFLAKLVGPTGQVLAYDIQEEALLKTRTRLEQEGCLQQVKLFHKGHQLVEEELYSLSSPIAGATFNLGYLPGGDKNIVTVPETTIEALRILARYLRKNGLITVVIYPGHEEGKIERDIVLEEVSSWSQEEFQILRYQFINQKNNPPFLIAIQKK